MTGDPYNRRTRPTSTKILPEKILKGSGSNIFFDVPKNVCWMRLLSGRIESFIATSGLSVHRPQCHEAERAPASGGAAVFRAPTLCHQDTSATVEKLPIDLVCDRFQKKNVAPTSATKIPTHIFLMVSR